MDRILKRLAQDCMEWHRQGHAYGCYIYIMDSAMGRVGLWMTMKLMMIFIYLAVVVSDYE